MNKEIENAIARLKIHKEYARINDTTCVVNIRDIEILLNYVQFLNQEKQNV